MSVTIDRASRVMEETMFLVDMIDHDQCGGVEESFTHQKKMSVGLLDISVTWY